MSLKIYRDGKVQDFLKTGTGNLLFGIQISRDFKLIPIYNAYPEFNISNPVSIAAVKITIDKKEIERVVLPIDLISFDINTNQYLVDDSKVINPLMDAGIYYLEFSNGVNIFKSEAFLITKESYFITADMGIITADSGEYTADQVIYN